MMSEATASRLLAKIADSAFRPDLWPSVLADLSAFADARGALLIPLSGDVAGLQVTDGLLELLDVYVRDGWNTNDFRYRGKAKMLRDGITVDQDIIDADRIRREPFYEALLAPLGLRWFAGLSITSGPMAWALTLQRGIDTEPFGVKEQEKLLRFVAPIQDAVRIGRTIRSAHAQGSVDQLSTQDIGCLLFDETGRVTYLNDAAGALIGTTIDIRHGRLRLKCREQTRAVDRRMQMALRAPSLDSPPCSAPVLVGHPTPGYLLRVTPFALDTGSCFNAYRGMVQVRSIHRDLAANVALVEATFGLTRREAALLRAFLKTSDLTEAARRAGISHETARTHIKSIFMKTGTKGQVELVAMVASCG